MELVWLSVCATPAHSSLALPLLHRACRDVPGISWQAVHATLREDAAAVAARVIALAPAVVAATLYLFNRRVVLDTLARVKARYPECGIWVGGPECLGDNRDLLRRHPWVDLAVRGEGEAVMPELLRRRVRGEPLAGLPGVCCRLEEGELAHRDDRAVFAAWAEAPAPARDRFYALDRPFVQVETSRGCPGHCTYCTSGGSAPLRLRPLAAVREEIAYLRQQGVRQIRLLDRTFNAPPERAAALLDMIRDEFPGLLVHLELNPADLPPALRQRLRNARPGTLHIEAGLQTTSCAAAAAVGRQAPPSAAVEGVEFLCSCRHLQLHVDLMAGLPRQTLADVERDIELLLALGPNEIQLELLKVLPGTPLCAQARELGLCYAPVPPYEVVATPTLGAADLRRAAGWSQILDRFYNPASLRALVRGALAAPGAFVAFAGRCEAAGLLATPVSLERRFRFLADTVVADQPALLGAWRLAWLDAGMSPHDSRARASPWRASLPDGAEWRYGEESRAGLETARFWHLATPTAEYWFVYDRRLSPHAPVACLCRRRGPATV